LVEPIKRGALPGRDGGKAARVKGSSHHDRKRREEINEERHKIEAEKAASDAVGRVHFATSVRFTRKIRSVTSTTVRHKTRSTRAYAAPLFQSPPSKN